MEWIRIFEDVEKARERMPVNKPELIIVGSRRICLVRREHEWLAVSDRCTHNSESLSKGHVNFQGDIICPWHGYRFSMKTGQCFQSASDLTTYPVKEEGDAVFIGV